MSNNSAGSLPTAASIVPPASTTDRATRPTATMGSASAAGAGASAARRRRLPRVRLSLAWRFLSANLAILLLAGLLVGTWIGDTLERGIIDRTASVTAVYVESFVAPNLQQLAPDGTLPAADVDQLDAVLKNGPLGDVVVSLRIWSPAGTIVYGSIRELVGQTFPIKGELAEALGGNVTADLSGLTDMENAVERRQWARLLEMYVPVRRSGTDQIIAVAEFYQLPDAIDREVANARLVSWLLVAAAIGGSFLLLFGIVKQGSDTIGRQEAALQRQVGELSDLLARNAALSDRVRAAAERATTLRERTLRRISGDLHDGPGQTLALALMRFDALKAARASAGTAPGEVEEVEAALRDALRDMRAIAAGLRMPELAPMDVREVVTRAVDDHVRRTGMAVEVTVDAASGPVALPVKIALFRALQELLSNALRHAGGAGVSVVVATRGGDLTLVVADHGPGLDVARLSRAEGLGLAGMREQAQLLGGDFEIASQPGQGTEIRLRWPLARVRESMANGAPGEPGPDGGAEA